MGTTHKSTRDIPIRTVMHPAPITTSPSQLLSNAKKTMIEHNVRHLPVQNGGRIVGVLSERDILFMMSTERERQDDLKVKDAMTEPPYIVSPDTKLSEVARQMGHDRIGSALIVEEGRCIGIFTTVDACVILAQALKGQIEQ